nr:low-specificity L-threonine aldolase [Lysobacter sp.]
VSVCLSKGLGAPVGSVLLGTQALIDIARRWRKVVGGGMRQSGILAAAALHALDHHVDALADDHARASRLAEALRELPDVGVIGPFTNMVFVQLPAESVAALAGHMASAGVRLPAANAGMLRMVLHRDIGDEDVARVADAMRGFFGNG